MNGKDANVGGKYTSFRSEKSNKTGSKNGTISQTWHIGNTSDGICVPATVSIASSNQSAFLDVIFCTFTEIAGA